MENLHFLLLKQASESAGEPNPICSQQGQGHMET